MKLYATSDQTAKLIELGFDKPKSIEAYKDGHCVPFVEQQWTYSIGELIEILPTTIMDKIWWGEEKGEDGIWGLRIDTECTDFAWVISYRRDNSAYLYQEGRSELVDALYDMVVRLKKEGVI